MLLAHVEAISRAAHHGEGRVRLDELGDRLGNEVHVLHRDHRVFDTYERAHLIGPETGGDDEVLGNDLAACRCDLPLPRRQLSQAGNRRVAMDLGARGAAAPRQGLAELRRVDVTIERIPQRRQDVVAGEQGMTAQRLGGIEQLEVEADTPGNRHDVVAPVDLFPAGEQAQPANIMVVRDRIVGIGRQLPVQVDRVLAHQQQ